MHWRSMWHIYIFIESVLHYCQGLIWIKTDLLIKQALANLHFKSYDAWKVFLWDFLHGTNIENDGFRTEAIHPFYDHTIKTIWYSWSHKSKSNWPCDITLNWSPWPKNYCTFAFWEYLSAIMESNSKHIINNKYI